jgi:RNA polymerase sigma factor (sigma-70 family)
MADARLATQFQETRAHLQGVAYRLLGSSHEAEEAVQETWIRLDRTDATDIENLSGWLTTVVARVSLDMLRARASRRESAVDFTVAGEAIAGTAGPDPEGEALLAESVGSALLVVLETLAPAERLAFVLHDLFAVPHDEVSSIIGCSPAAARQLASRARRRVQGASTPDVNAHRHRQVVDAFLAASRSGEFDALLTLLDPDAVLRSDAAAIFAGAPTEVLGGAAVARTFSGRARAAQGATIEGHAGAVWAPEGVPKVVFRFVISGDRIVAIAMLSDPMQIGTLAVVVHA